MHDFFSLRKSSFFGAFSFFLAKNSRTYSAKKERLCNQLDKGMGYWDAVSLILYSIDTYFDASTTDSFENIVGKEEIARNEQFLFFPQCFLLNQVIVSPFVHIFNIISLFAAEFGRAQNWRMS